MEKESIYTISTIIYGERENLFSFCHQWSYTLAIAMIIVLIYGSNVYFDESCSEVSIVAISMWSGTNCTRYQTFTHWLVVGLRQLFGNLLLCSLAANCCLGNFLLYSSLQATSQPTHPYKQRDCFIAAISHA